MKTFNTAIVTAFLAIGLAGNAAAAPNHTDRVVLKQLSHQNAHKSAKVAAKKQGQKKVVKRAVKQKVYKAPAKRVVKKTVYKAPTKRVVQKRVKSSKVAKRVYRVRSGDTLYRIALRNHVSVQKLIKINKLWGKKASNLRVGMVLRLA